MTVKENIFITGIDQSSAFDTIDRTKLLKILSDIVNKDELILIRYLLANTSLEINMNKVVKERFETNVGSPQGDGISGTLFTVYFEHSPKDQESTREYMLCTSNNICL